MKLGNLVDSLLVYARLAKADLSFEQVDLGEVIDSQADYWSKSLGTPFNIVRPSEVVVFGDKTHLRTAISAIVGNAGTYRKSGSTVCLAISCDQKVSDIVISFRDDGIGFDTQYLHKIFQPFERLHRDTEYPGVGMGLATVARIAERHGGDVTADSIPGEGATFHLRLGNQLPIGSSARQLVSV